MVKDTIMYKKNTDMNTTGNTVLNFDDESWGPKAEKISIWHFDTTVPETLDDVVSSPVCFKGNWDEDIKKVTNYLRDTATYDMDVWNDLGYASITATQSTLKLDVTEFPQFKKMVDFLELKNNEDYQTRVLVFRQLPGQILPSHIDNYKKPTEIHVSDTALNAVRFAVALNNWTTGHYWHFGNAVWQQWNAGDCVHWHRTMPHGTANVGHTPRWTLQITGLPSKKTQELIDANKKIEVLI